MCSKPDAPEPIDAGQSQGKYLFGRGFRNYEGVTDPELQKRWLASEREFRPQWAELNLQDMNTYLGGTEGQGGLLDIQRRSAEAASANEIAAASAKREAEIGDVEALGSRATEAFRASDPYTQSILANQNALSADLYDRARRVTPEQARAADQQSRAAFASRGRLNDNAGVASEILGRESVLRGNRAEAMQAGNQTLAMNKATASDPFQAILGRSSGAAQLGTNYAGGAQSLLGTATPQLFDDAAGVNLDLANNANQSQYDAAIYGGQMGMFGSILGGALGGAGSYFGGKKG